MLPKIDLDQWLHDRLLTVEDELVDASNGDPKTMKTFLDRIGEVQRMASRAIAENSLTTRTAALIRSVASMGAALARLTSEVQIAGTAVERKRQSRLQDAMAKLSLNSDPQEIHNDRSASSESASTRGSVSTSKRPSAPVILRATESSVTDTRSLPPHVLRCYEWLLQNLHDPYPPSTFRSRVSKDTGVSQRTICDWFTNVRRKIGWTAISRRHFSRERTLAVDCARVVLLGEESKVSVCKELQDAFLAMKDMADRLFGDILGPSEAAKHLDDLVTRHSSKPGHVDQGSSKRPSKTGRQQVKERNSRASTRKVLGKRCASSDECIDSDAVCKSSSEGRQVKRLRNGSSMNSSNPRDVVDSSQLHMSPGPMIPSNSADSQRSSLKRHLSDEEELRSTKHCRSLSDNKVMNDLGTSSEADGLNSFSFIPSDNTYNTTNDSVTPSPPTTLLTVSDESIGGPLSSPLEEAIVNTCFDPDSSTLTEFFNFKDVVDLPDIAIFTWDGTNILPPSFEPIPLSADFSVSHPELNDDPSHCLPNLVDFDSSWLSSLELNLCPESKLNLSVPSSTNIQEPESDAALFSDFFQEVFCSQVRSEQSTGKAGEL
ncbi:hypothetical protein ACEPAF_3934 [Sanghuangporus sanghuang]